MTHPWQRDRDLDHLHPVLRDKVNKLLDTFSTELLPFQPFEGFRPPHRQQYLYEQGRKRPGPIVTRARPWTSYHQYGLAADFVLYENGKWNWDTSGEKARWWNRLHELAREEGLEPLSWELPHLQLPDLDIADLHAGRYPSGGDQTWAECLEAAIYSWSGTPESPPVPTTVLPDRPPLEPTPIPALRLGETPGLGTADWHSKYGGQEWRYDERGVYLRDHLSGREPLRTRGKPVTCRTIWSLFTDEIMAASIRHDIPVAIIMMVIATETSFARNYSFTGLHTFRWEPHVEVHDVSPPVWGDYSAGPMQILGTTARWIIKAQDLDYDPFQVAPVFEDRPEPPESLSLYDPAVNIDIGTAVIKHRTSRTGNDPILVAAAYNSGGLYKTTGNAWHLRTTGNHLDRAGRWYGDACAVLKELEA